MPHTPQIPPGPIDLVRVIVHAHDGLDGLGGFFGVVVRDGGAVVVQHVGVDDAVEEEAPEDAEVAVHGCGGAAGEGPGRRGVVREGGVGVVEVGYCCYLRG